MKMTFKGPELQTPGMEVTKFLNWSGHNGFLPPYFSPEAQGIGQLQANPLALPPSARTPAGPGAFSQSSSCEQTVHSPPFRHCLRGSGCSTGVL